MSIKARIYSAAVNVARRLRPPSPQMSATEMALSQQILELRAREARDRTEAFERLHEWREAQQMAGSGPWTVSESQRLITSSGDVQLREADPLLSQGATGDLELALNNVEWRREINLSWLEFSRWGIQQLILISRLYYIKNPICRRLVDVCAAYVFARGVEVSSDDDDANAVIEDFFERNKKALGHVALVAMERAKDTDGNIFVCFFADTTDKGLVNCRTIDATEIMEVVTNPDDVDDPWFYKRVWTQRVFDLSTGSTSTQQGTAWYPALGYDPKEKPELINQDPVLWQSPVYHRKCGGVAKWHFGCPRIYPMLDWAKEARRFLEACASIRQSLSQFALTLTTKGGQQAIEAAKQQLQTNVGPPSSLLDTNPPAISGSIFASGPGTKMEAFKTSGAGFDPEGVRQYKLMCCMVKGVPETFLADVSTGNLATATSLDRPTETVFLEMQEEWIEDLTTIAQHVLSVSSRAPSGKLRESARGITMWPRRMNESGFMVYEAKPKPGKINVRVDFPAIREGDIPALVNATVNAMTLANHGGQVVGIDEKEGVRLLGRFLGIEEIEELVEAMYPAGEYKPDRTKAILPNPISLAPPVRVGGQPQNPGGKQTATPEAPPVVPSKASREALAKAADRLLRGLKILEASAEQEHQHEHANGRN